MEPAPSPPPPEPAVTESPRSSVPATFLLLFLWWLVTPLLGDLLMLPGLVLTVSLFLRRDSARWMWFLASPLLLLPGFSAGNAVVSYFCGKARIHVPAFGGPEARNLDPVVRCPKDLFSCSIPSTFFSTIGVNDLTVMLCGRLFGPMPGSYDGPYPSREEAQRILAEKGREAPAAHWRAGESSIRRDGQHSYTFPYPVSMSVPDPETTITATVLENRCLLALVPPREERMSAYLYLIDLPTSGVVARYSVR